MRWPRDNGGYHQSLDHSEKTFSRTAVSLPTIPNRTLYPNPHQNCPSYQSLALIKSFLCRSPRQLNCQAKRRQQLNRQAERRQAEQATEQAHHLQHVAWKVQRPRPPGVRVFVFVLWSCVCCGWLFCFYLFPRWERPRVCCAVGFNCLLFFGFSYFRMPI